MPETTGVETVPLGQAEAPGPGRTWSTVTNAVRDGTVSLAVGAATAAAFGPEIVKTLVTGETGR